MWHYNNANVHLLRRCIVNVDWDNHFRKNSNPNWQAESFTEVLLNIISNYVPNKIAKVKPKEPPWISNHLKSMLKKQNRLYRNYKRHSFKSDDKIRMDQFNNECKPAVDHAKQSHLNKLGTKLSDPNISKKSYWKVVNKVMNKCRAPKIPPLLDNNNFITDCKMKANIFFFPDN